MNGVFREWSYLHIAKTTIFAEAKIIYSFIVLCELSMLASPFNITTLTHWGRMAHICVGKLTMIGSDNGLSPGRRQAIIWNNFG